ncbi:uncharacterized protein LOC141849345 [Brevipalpus obovatus]|uniref:uncharacterized protein LOC141849345 n=1 Tax=Brevipalpus obovatus TaxID=246614 RepID=UPI003D9E5716
MCVFCLHFRFVLIMENVVSNPLLVQKIISFLPIKDVQQCQLVNRVWYEEAYRQLIEYPIDYCCVFYEDRLLGESHGYHIFYSAHFKRASHHSEVRNEDRVNVKFSQDFFGRGMRCIPSVSFICYDVIGSYRNDLGRINFHHPVVLIERNSFKLDQKAVFLELPRAKTSSRETFVSIGLEALHINRYTSKNKIIITDWSDTNDLRPNFDDEESPIKSLIFFNSLVQCPPDFHTLLRNESLNVSGGRLNGYRDCPSFIDSNQQRKYPGTMSIAFAGKGVESAVFNFCKSPNIEGEDLDEDFGSDLEEFTKNLDFQIDDGQVFGFLFFKRRPIYSSGFISGFHYDDSNLDRALKFILKLYPELPLLRICMTELIDCMDVSFHLIRFDEKEPTLSD